MLKMDRLNMYLNILVASAAYSLYVLVLGGIFDIRNRKRINVGPRSHAE